MPTRKSAGYPPEVLKKMLQVTYNEESSGYDKERFMERPHDVRLMRLVRNLLSEWTIGSRVLQLASGTGYWGEYLTDLGYEYQGLELTDGMCSISRAKGLSVIQGDVEDSSKYPKGLDTIICVKAFGFFTDPIQVLRNVGEALSFGGRFICFYYNDRYHNGIVRLYSLLKDPDNIAYQPPWDVRYTWREFRAMAKVGGLKVEYLRDCVVLPYRWIPKRHWSLADRLDNKLTRFGFVTMGVCKKL